MNKLDDKKRAQIIHLLVEGNSLRATGRVCDVSRNSVDKLLQDVGKACSEYQDRVLRNLPCQRVQCDEIWSFCYAKSKNVPEDKQGQFGYGDVWTWVAMCADTKLVPAWLVADRSAGAAHELMQDLAHRLQSRVQLTTDGYHPYLEAVEGAFGSDVDYAQLVKIYGQSPDREKRYSPPECVGAKKQRVQGSPDRAKISTSYVERQNLTMRMSMRRFTRLTNAFSKKIENHAHAISLHYMWYNFGRIHKSLRVTPAMEAGVTDHVWTVEEIVALAQIEAPKQRGPYKKEKISN